MYYNLRYYFFNILLIWIYVMLQVKSSLGALKMFICVHIVTNLTLTKYILSNIFMRENGSLF
jgi:hypothetical protein